MWQCDICKQEFPTPQGLRGHKTFKHGVTKAMLSSGKTSSAVATANVNNNKLVKQLEELEGVVGMLDDEISGLRSEVAAVSLASGKVPSHSHTCDVSYSQWRDLGRRLDGIAGSIKLLAVALWEHSHEGSDDKLVMLPSDSHDKVANLAGMPKTIDRILGSICDGKSKCFNLLRKDGWCKG